MLLFSMATLLFCGAYKIEPRANFTGTWVLNLSKSDFGDNPLYVVPKQAKISGDNESLNIEMVVIAVSGADSTMKIKLSTAGKPVDVITADKRTRHYNTTWTESEQTLKVEYSSSYSGKPDTEQYHTTDTWKLSADGKELTLNKEVKVDSGYGYTVKAVYDKQ
ncbi:MAG: hypothetical protein JWR50_1987 [Mucilaginibacter sp.]|nr:hypothetical protein [Mucilaginibacter sp.]